MIAALDHLNLVLELIKHEYPLSDYREFAKAWPHSAEEIKDAHRAVWLAVTHTAPAALAQVECGNTPYDEGPFTIAPVQAVPDGWKLVPVEPTPEMAKAFQGPLTAVRTWRQNYIAMLAAAPQRHRRRLCRKKSGEKRRPSPPTAAQSPASRSGGICHTPSLAMSPPMVGHSTPTPCRPLRKMASFDANAMTTTLARGWEASRSDGFTRSSNDSFCAKGALPRCGHDATPFEPAAQPAPQAPLTPLTEAKLWELRAQAKSDERTVDQHWFVLFARAIEAAHGIAAGVKEPGNAGINF